MPSASPFYSTNFPGMDKTDISNETAPLFDLWGESPIIHPGSFQRISQPESQSTCVSISQSQALIGCGTGTTSTTSRLDSHQGFVDNANCTTSIQHPPGLVSPRAEPYTDIEYQTFATWAQKHPENWSPREVLDWLYSTADQHSLDGSKLRGEAFQTLPGSELCRMSLEDFVKAEPEFGDLYYQVFQNLLKSAGDFGESASSPPRDIAPFTELDFSSCLSTSPPAQVDSRLNSAYTAKPSCPSLHGMHPAHMSQPYGYPCPAPPSDAIRNPFSCSKHEPVCIQPQTTSSGEYGKCELDQFADFSLADPTPNSCTYMTPYFTNGQFPMPGHHTPPYMSSPPTLMHPVPQVPQQRKPGRPRKSPSVGCVADLHGRHRRGTGKNQHLWEFIYDTLMNPMYSPQFLRWENKQDGIFRFVQSEAVAQLWGNLKNNDNMTYEKLSRAMRHYYKRGILERVEGRRLVYKFSQTAMDRMRQRLHSV